MDLKVIQDNILKLGADGWLFCDIGNRDKIAYEILGIENKMTTRRWFYLIPSIGTPIKLVHRIEQYKLDNLPGEKRLYTSWVELHNELRSLLSNTKNLFMQYSPLNNLPLVSFVDAGTIELINSFGAKVLSSADIVQICKSKLDEVRIKMHALAGEKIQRIKDDAFALVKDSILKNAEITEYDVQQFILQEFKKEGITCEDEFPIVAVNEHAANPHFCPEKENSYIIRKSDRLLIDIWGKIDSPMGVYYDITWCGHVGTNPSEEYLKIFNIVKEAREVAKNFINENVKKNKQIYGWEVDKACRDYIAKMGYGDYFIHRTGHSIDSDVHGSGVNLDNLETKDDRMIISGSCFSIEPGIYKDDIGVRSEIDVLVNEDSILVFGEEQQELITMDL